MLISFLQNPVANNFVTRNGVMGMNKKTRRSRLGGYLKRAIVFMVMCSMMLGDIGMYHVEASEFSYKWIGSASSSGKFKFSDGSSDSAGYGYSIDGVGKVFCINQGSEIYNKDNYTSKGEAKFRSEGKSDFSYDGVVAKIAYYWISNKNDDFARSLTQALIWQAVDKGYTSKKSLKNIIKQSKTSDADNLFKEIFEVDDEIKAVITTYKSSNYGSSQRMAKLSAQIIEDNTEFSYATYKKSMSYRQVVRLHKVDADGKAIGGVVFVLRLSDGMENLASVSMQRGTLLKPVNASDLSKGFNEVLEKDADGSVVGTQVTKSAEQINDMYPDKVIYVKTDANGDIRIRFAYKITSKEYAYGRYKKGDKWLNVNSYEQAEKLSDNKDPEHTVNGHSYMYWMRMAYENSGDDSTWVAFKDRAKYNVHGKNRMDSSGKILSDEYSDLRNEFENISTYIGISELAGKNGNTYYDNTLSINPTIDGNYKWINITKTESRISNSDSVSDSNKKNVAYTKIGSYKNKDGGVYTNSDYVDISDNTWLSISKQEDNENSYTNDEARVTVVKLNNRDNIVDAYYKYGVDSLSENRKYERTFGLHKVDEDGKVISDAWFEFKVDLLGYIDEIKNVYVNGNQVEIHKVDDKEEASYDKENVESCMINNSNLIINTLSDGSGDIKVKLEFEKKYENYKYGYGRYFDYASSKYVDIKDDNVYKNLTTAIKSGIGEVVRDAYGKKKYTFYDEKSYSVEGARSKVRDKIDAEFDKFIKDYQNKQIKVMVKELDVLKDDTYAINAEYSNGKVCNFDNDEVINIVDNRKCFSTKIIKIGPDGVKKLDGAIFEVYEDEKFTIPAKFYDKDGNFINKDGKAVAYTTKDGELVTDYLRCRKDEYYLKEIKAPEGYVSIYDDSNKENDVIKIKCDGSEIADTEYYVDEAVNVEVKNQCTTIRFEKRDKDTKELIDGAKIVVTDSKGNVILRFESSKSGNLFRGTFVAGEEYIFHESKAPKGYDDTKDVKFIVKATDEVQTVSMYDEKISIVKANKRHKEKKEKEDKGGGGNIITPKTGIFINDYRRLDENNINENMHKDNFGNEGIESIGILLIMSLFLFVRRMSKGRAYE